MASLEESRRENRELRHYQDDIKNKYKKKGSQLKRILREKEKEVIEL